MQPGRALWRTILAAAVVMTLAGSLSASDVEPPDKRDRSDKGPKPTRGTGSIILPDFNPKNQFKVIQKGLEKSVPIGQTIKDAHARLAPLIEKLKRKPDLQIEAEVEKELANFVDRLSLQVVNLIGERDRILWAFRDLNRGIGKMRSSISIYVVDLKRRIAGEQAKMKRLEQELRELAQQVRDAQGSERVRLGRRLAMLDRKHQLLASAMDQYEKLARSFGASGTGLDKLENAFTRMAQNVTHLLDVLDVQYEILRFSAGTRRDFSRIKEMFARVMGGSEADLKKIMARLKDVNGQITFLGEFMQTVGEINSFNSLISDADSMASGILNLGTPRGKSENDLEKLLVKWTEPPPEETERSR